MPKPPRNGAYLLAHCKYLARQIELLHPAVDAAKRPDNCEYPWEQGGQLYVPAEWSFPAVNLVNEPHGRTLLKIIKVAIQRLTS